MISRAREATEPEPLRLKHPFQERRTVEKREIPSLFAGAYVTGWNARFPRDCDRDTTFSRTVQFSEYESSERRGGMKFPGLNDGIAAGCGVGDKKNLMR